MIYGMYWRWHEISLIHYVYIERRIIAMIINVSLNQSETKGFIYRRGHDASKLHLFFEEFCSGSRSFNFLLRFVLCLCMNFILVNSTPRTMIIFSTMYTARFYYYWNEQVRKCRRYHRRIQIEDWYNGMEWRFTSEKLSGRMIGESFWQWPFQNPFCLSSNSTHNKRASQKTFYVLLCSVVFIFGAMSCDSSYSYLLYDVLFIWLCAS